MGSVYQRGKSWRIWYLDQSGRRVYEGGRKGWSHADAKDQLRRREAEVANREFQGKHIDEIPFSRLADLLIEDYTINKRKSLRHTTNRVNVLRKYFGNTRAINVPAMVKPFILDCQQRDLSNAYINRFLSALRRAFQLGYDHIPRLVASVPHFPKLEENNIREGYYEHDEYMRLHNELPPYLRLAVTIAYISGVREGEIFGITLRQVNFVTGAIRLRQMDTKNNQPRVFYLTGKYYEELDAQRQELTEKYPDCPFLIHNQGRPIRSFREAWASACRRAEIPGRLFHDLRRTAARNMQDAGVPEKQIMQIGGWKTRSVFDRYNIVNEKNLRRASDKVLAYLEQQEAELKSR